MKKEEIQFLNDLDKLTLPLITAQIRVNPNKTEVICMTHNGAIRFLNDSFKIDKKDVDDLILNYLEKPLDKLNHALKNLIENDTTLDASKTGKDLKA